MKDFTKFILCALGGTIFGLIYKLNKEKINQSQIELNILKNHRSVSVSQLMNSFSESEDSQQNLFVEGEIGTSTENLKSTNCKYLGVYIKKLNYELEIIENNNSKTKQRRQTSGTINTTDSFLLNSQPKSNINVLINNFSDTIIMPKVLKHQHTDQIIMPPEVRTIMREPKTDEEKAQFKQGNIKKFLTTISKIGVIIEEDILCEGTFICVYGNVIWDRFHNTFRITSPKYFGISKDQIIEYFEADQYFIKFIGILLAIGGTAFSIFAIKYLYNMISKKSNSQEKNYQILTKI